MAMRLLFVLIALIMFMLFPISALGATASRTIEDRYEITLEWQHNPAILGDTNGARVRITENGEPVPGAKDNLTVQVEFMEAVRVLNMIEDTAQPGTYTGVFIPMQEGEYTFSIFGTIGDTPVTVSFTSADGLVAVEPRTDYEFPNVAFGGSATKLVVPATVALVVGGLLLASSRRHDTTARF